MITKFFTLSLLAIFFKIWNSEAVNPQAGISETLNSIFKPPSKSIDIIPKADEELENLSEKTQRDLLGVTTCPSGCLQCSSTSYNGCDECKSWYFLLAGECLTVCPDGFSYTGAWTCEKGTSSPVFDISFDKIKGFLEINSDSGDCLVCGNDPYRFYPDYDSNDPFPTKDRGYYFDSSSSYMQMPPNSISKVGFRLNVDHTFSIWAYQISDADQSLFKKFDSQGNKIWGIRTVAGYIYYEWTHLKNGANDFSAYSYATGGVQVWNNYVFTFSKANGAFESKFYMNNAFVDTNSYDGDEKLIWDDEGPFYIGYSQDPNTGSGVGWTGFIAKISYYIDALSVTDISAFYGTCTNSCNSLCIPSGDCFSECDIYHYAETTGTCDGACGSSCTNPCVFSDRCTLCYSSSVTKCSGFGDGDKLDYSCYGNCETCGDSYYYTCLSCSTGFYLHHDTCITACPTSYHEATDGCTGSGGYVYDFILSEISGTITDTYGYFSLNSGSDSTKFYPNADSSDAIPAYQRGYYFNGESSYMALDNKIMFNYYQTHGFWLRNEGGTNTQSILSAVDDHSNSVLKIEITDTSLVLAIMINPDPKKDYVYILEPTMSFFDIPKHSWVYLTVLITFIRGTTYWKAYNFNDRTFIFNIYDGVMEPALPSYVTFGATRKNSAVSNYFKGFIYEMVYMSEAASSYKISQLFSTSCSGCTYCTASNLICLDKCGIHYYGYYGSCLPCMSTCKYGCISATTCNLCNDPGCYTCSVYETETCTQCYTDATVGTDLCGCNSGSANFDDVSGTCVECSSYCSKCNWPYMLECSSCPTGRYLTSEGICTPYCPYGCGDASRTSIIVDYVFTSISNSQTDSANQLIMYLGSKDDYYSTYDDNDPKILPYRGLYFTGSSYAQFPPTQYNDSQLYLGYSHSVDFWLFPLQYSGSIMSKFFGSSDLMYAEIVGGSDTLYKICYHLYSVDNSNSDNLCSSATITSSNSWGRLTWTFGFSSGVTTLSTYLDGTHQDTQTFTDNFIFDEDLYLNFVLGYSSSLSYYVGYIYSIKIYNYILGSISAGNSNCGCQWCTELGACLSTCAYNEAYNKESNSCESCPQDCKNGCKTSSACSICNNYLCSSCSNVEADGCRVCTTNAEGYITDDNNSDCRCYNGYYGNPSSLICESCFSKCTTCTGAYANACTACKDNWYLLPEGICVKTCPPGYSSDDNFICSVAISTFLIAFQFDALKNTQSDIGYKSLEIYCGNSDDFYPNYDSNDPWVLKDRGLYFSGNSYATYLKANNLYPFYFGIKHTFDIWAMPRYYEGDSMIYSKYSSDRDLITLQVSGTSSSYFLKICYNFISVVDGSTATLQCITSGKYDYSVWKRISWTIGYSSTDGSKISVYVDSTLLESATVPDTYFDENVDFTINLGSKSTASYFTGYIYSIYWYNYVITDFSQGDNTCGCMACDNQNNCLVTCTENEYYSEGSCVSCKSGCSGCINGDSCNMCDDQLCSTCSSLKAKSCTECTTNSEFDSSNICVCKDKYGKDIDACSPCDSSCETCSGISMYQCKSCASSSYLTSEGICSSICAFGCGDSTRNSLIVDFLFTAISNDQKDSINSIELFLGSSTDYYPNYDSEDPKILEYRGLYFSGSSNAKLHPNSYNSSQLYLGFSHSVDTWAFLSTDQTGQGCLITKSTSSLGPIMTLAFIYSNGSPLISICYVLQALDSSTTSNTCAFLPTTLGEWHRISLSLAFKDGESTLYIYLDGVASDPQVIAGFFYEDYNDGIFELGSYGSTNFIIGYIYSLKIYNYPKTDFSSSSSGCGCQACTDSDQCLSTCTVSESYNKDQRICESCLAGCQANGCVAADRCNICFDPICAACTTFEYGSCKRCRDHAAYDSDGICKCNSQFYWDKDAEACKACGTLCSSCSDKENCDKCLDDNTMSIDSENVGNCKCNGYAYYNGNECEACGDLCVSCDSTGCLKCADTTNMHTNSADSDHSCICNDGLYYDTTSAECKSCINQCKTCDSETSCTSCVDNADLNTGSCTCQTGYWASSDTWNCEACFKECEKCTGSSTNKCTSCLNSWLLLSEGFCAKDCPVNYEKSQTADSCTLVQSLLSITYKFNFLTNTQVDKDVGTFELYYGSSDDFYPNYDSNDPWVLQDRGLYFSGSSYATFLQNSGATPFVFGFYHTFDLWAMPRYYEGDGVIMAKYSSSRDLITLKVHGSSTDYYLEICYDFISISDGITSNFKCVQSGSYSFSEWKRISWSADMSSSYTSSLNLYVDSTLLNSALVPESFFDESVDFTTRLGSKSTNSYFTGYLYSFSYSSYVISSFDQGTNSCGCSICDNQNNCLGTCSESEYYSGTSCMSCKSDCSWCINGNSCNMCNDQLCSQCASLQANDCRECTNNAKFDDSDLCICNDGYTPNIDTCALCDSSCATCSGTNMYQCKSCYSAHYLTSEGICSGYCAFGCGDSTRNSLIVDFLFTKILNDQQESENLIEIYLGSSNDYYPDYDSSDPKILKYRGLYFSGSSSAKLPPNPYNSSQFYLGFSHAIDTWVYISPDQTNKGYAIAKWSSSSNIMGAGIDFQGSTPMIVVCYGLPSLDLSTSSNTCANFKTTTGEWHRYSWSLEFNDGESTIAIYVDGSFSAAQTANGYNYEGYTDAAFELGNFNSQDFFIGYIYSLKIYNYPRSDFSSSSSGCGCQACTDSDQCLSSCAVSESYNKDQNVCESCLSSCQNIGCVAADRCNVCFDPICNTCITFEKGSCTGCKVNADYDSNRMCKCNSEFYWDKSSETCKACGTLCSSCSDKENCDKCLDDNTMSIDPESLGNCKCNGYAYYNGNECEECGDLCVSCDSTGCLKCADTTNMHINSADSDHSCICNDGLYYDTTSTECKKCKSPCSLCKNENFCLSCIDSSMSLNDGICTCPSDQYFNDAESLCKSCINQCLACESETSCTSCVDHADLVDKSCNCQDGYTPYNNICSLCSSCLTCNGNEIYNCLSCATDQYLTAEGICSSYCAHGCSDTIRNSLIVNYIFSSISNAQHDLANSIEMVLGDSSSYYPNYDYYDPKILPYRGLYFDGSSYAQVSPASSQFYLGYSHTVDLWVYALSGITDTHAVLASLKSDSSTNELAAVQLSGSDTLFTSCYLLSDFTKSATSNLCLSSAVTENSWFRFTWTLKFSSGENTLVFYSNSEYKDQKTLLSYFYDESDNSGFFLGGYSSQYFFSGYIYSFTIYNYVLTTLEAGNNNCGCQACSDLNQCLSTCSSSEAYKLESNSCESCPNNCQNGCLTSSYCGICEDSLCSTCDDSWGSCSTCVSNADFNSNHVCECGSNYVISADLISCNPCNSMCAECSGREANKCKGCVGGSYMTTDGYCVFNCQLGYSSQDGTTCSAVNSDSLMVNFIFNQLSNTQLDTVSSLPIFFGTNSSFYPNYDENDPKVLKNRGLYFNGKSYGTLFNDGSSTAQVSFGHVHTFEIWLLVMASTEDMIVISKSSSDSALFLLKIQASSQTYSISLCYDFINLSDETIKNNECVSSQSSSYNKWTKISWILEKWNDNDFLLKLYLLSNLENSVVASSSYFNENSAAEVKIGSMRAASFFKGYIYSLRIHNYAIGHINGDSVGCGCSKCTEYGDCLADCLPSEYYSSNQCSSCLSSCTNGCVSGNTCNLCSDPICSKCTSLESGTCTTCKSDSTLDSNDKCVCDKYHYWSSTLESCETCSKFCGSCTSAELCQYCMDNDTMVLDNQNPGSCKCSDSAYSSPTGCFKCGTLCSSCSDQDNCNKCLDENTMSIDPENLGSCKCNGYAYYNGNECEECGDLCVSCDSTGCLKCADTTNMHTNSADSDHSCICNDGLYYDTTLTECRSCINQCKTCESETSCTSCVDNADFNTGSCICQDGYWASSDTWKCEACFKECEKCTGSSTNKCTGCLNSLLLLSEGFCVKELYSEAQVLGC
ncbi:unnamed protein product [Blepharisma stoltei]|uniref:TNFR-Cys domain-containing protein n=1 Tax=Blepharisma stoltei TaxID=1481888 RepID=A0AAU9K332_9CILI|nr:unnamed protein product [Blepharisma stoltei]